MSNHDTAVAGFRGEISDVEVLPEGDPGLPAAPDLAGMAEHALPYLANNPVPERNWECRFSFFLLNCPPFIPWVPPDRGFVDPVAIGDTESRNDVAFNQMREMTGSDFGREAQDAVHRRLVGYVKSGSGERGDDMSWIIPYCGSPDHDGEYAIPWTTGKLMHAETDMYRLTGKESHRRLARRLFEGLRRVAVHDTGRAYYPGACQAFRGDKYARGYEGHYPVVVGPAAHYGVHCGDDEALEFAVAMAEGFLADLQPGHHHKPDGSVHGHNHCQMHAVRGVAELGARLGERRFLEWAEAAHDFYWRNGFDTGWLPEHIFEPDHRNHSETCLTADMMEIEVWLARGGKPALWDQVERTVRNYLEPLQFFVTPEIEAFWRVVNADRSPAEVDESLRILRELEGGFMSSVAPNDLVFEVRPGGDHFGAVTHLGRRLVLDMMGCCPPEGMRALYLAWANVLTETPAGVLVNLAFDHDGPAATVHTAMPRAGRLTVTAKVGRDFWLRPPAWAPRGEVRALRSGVAVDPLWGGPARDYVGFRDVAPGEAMEITWPLVRFRQSVAETSWDGGPVPAYVFDWTGSLATGCTPRGEWLPICG
jgi:hypothetical protein